MSLSFSWNERYGILTSAQNIYLKIDSDDQSETYSLFLDFYMLNYLKMSLG